MKQKKKCICFVDDDPAEVSRFKKVFKKLFTVGVGGDVDLALEDLKRSGGKRPNLFLLDMYFGPHVKPEYRNPIADLDKKIAIAEAELRALLAKALISAEKGFEQVGTVRARLRQVPIAFFSRKAFLKDALRAHKQGLPVIEKPDPDESDEGTDDEGYDRAMERSANDLAIDFGLIIDRSKWWARNRKWFGGMLAGFIFFFLGVSWDAWKGQDWTHSLWVPSLAASIICFLISLKWSSDS